VRIGEIMEEEAHFNSSVLDQGILDRIHSIVNPKENIILAAQSDLYLNGEYGISAMVLTDKRIVAIDPAHEEGLLSVDRSRIEQCTIERMYGNSVFQIHLDDKIIDTNRFTNSTLDYFDRIYDYLNAQTDKKNGKKNGQEEAIAIEPDKRPKCPKCGRTIPDKNSVCVLCIDKKKVVKRLLTYIRPHYKLLATVMLFSLITTLVPLIPPYMTKILIDSVLPDGNLNRLWMIVATLFSLYLFNAVFAGRRIYNLRKLSEKIIFGLRTEVFAKVQQLEIKYYDKRSTGAIMSRVSNDTQRLQAFLITLTQDIILQLLRLLLIMVIMIGMHWQLTLLSLIPIPLVIIFSKIYAGKMRPKYRRIWRRVSRMNALLGDIIPGIKIVKAFSAEDRVVAQYTQQGEDLIDEQLGAAKMTSIFSPLITLMVMAGGLVIWALGGYWVITDPGKLSIGILIAFISYVGMFYGPVSFFANFNDQLQQAATSAERVFEIMDSEPEVDEGRGNIPETQQGAIEFQDVEFYYEKSNPVLYGINFSVNPGETIGIVGSTGSGKSTVANLLLRYYEVTEGAIRIDGQDIRTIDKEFLRKSIGYVLQEPLLFRDTVLANIAYSKPDASIEDVITAAKVANAHHFISKFPDAYDTMLGERGTGLSGGEKQRISIARAIIKNPIILILDEATSAVDTETEKLIQMAIDRLIENRTTLIIAHRLSTLRKAHHIMVIEEGKIVEFGTQNELLKNEDGRFYHLVQMQTDLGSDIIDYHGLFMKKDKNSLST
jgi:ATP-binding cassette, subfamily B, bacterial